METSLKTGFAQIFSCRSKHLRAIINNELIISIPMAQSITTLITTNFHLNLIQLWWQLLISNVCLWRRSLRSNLASIDLEKLYRATFICQFGLCCCIIWPLFLFDCFVKIGQLARIFGQLAYRLPWVPEVFLTCGGNFRCWWPTHLRP